MPVHPTAVVALTDYATARDRYRGAEPCHRFFVSDQGQPLPYFTVRTVFRRICEALQITGAGHDCTTSGTRSRAGASSGGTTPGSI